MSQFECIFGEPKATAVGRRVQAAAARLVRGVLQCCRQ